MKIAIVEDEVPARQQLVAMLKKLRSDVDIVNVSQSVAEAVRFWEEGGSPDLVFMDIQLNDGLSFDIFKKAEVRCPVIFTTAFDQYMLEAFHENGIDYLLKPIKQSELEAALGKFDRLKSHFADTGQLVKKLQEGQQGYKKRFLVKKGIGFKSVVVEEVQYFFSEHKVTFLVNKEGEKLLLDKPLADLEADLDPGQFFRINRKYIASINSIEQYKGFEKGKLIVQLSPAPKEEVIVSQEKAAQFREWMEG